MSRILIDTNVISESVRPAPDPAVLSWLAGQTPSDLYLAAPVLAELWRGAHKHRDPVRRARLLAWISDELRAQFDGRILNFDAAAAEEWGRIMGEADRKGRPLSAFDAQIAAVARVHSLTVATRNAADFADMDVPLVNPWAD